MSGFGARAEDGAHARVVDHALEIGEARLVAAGEVTLAAQHGAPHLYAQTPAFDHLDPCLEPLLVDGSRRRDHANHISGPDPGRLTDRRQAQLRAEIPAAS